MSTKSPATKGQPKNRPEQSASTTAKKTAARVLQPDDFDPEAGKPSKTTAISIPKTTWKLLRSVAFQRAQIDGGRASVSKLIVELVERHRGELEKETTVK